MQRQFIKVCTALGVVGMAGTAMAGTVRFDVSFSDVDIFFDDLAAGAVPANAQNVDTADPGRYVAAAGWSNVDVDVCWNSVIDPNTGEEVGTSGWASEVVFDIEFEEAGVVAWYYVGSPFAGDNTGTDTPDTCSNRLALDELQINLLPFTYKVNSGTGIVGTGMSSTWDDGTGLRHSFCNTADFFFVLAGAVPAGCDGATGSCGEANGTPGCEDISCCAVTCDPNAGGDSYCCDKVWDSYCVDIAVGLCGIFQYSCDAPAYANDCVSGAIMLANGDTIAFDTTGANTDGPDQAECGSAYEDLPIWSDLWYMVEVEGDGSELQIVATCCNTAFFDTKIAIYDAGAIGASFDPATLPDVFLTCNEDCADDAGDYATSEAIALVATGKQYLVRVGGFEQAVGVGNLTVSWGEPNPPLPAPECLTPGDTVVTQFVTATPTLAGGVGCGDGAANLTARSYPASMFGGAFEVSCVDFGWFANTDSYVPSEIRLHRSASANPNDAFIETLGVTQFGLFGPAGYTISSASFDAPVAVDLADGEFLVVELLINRQLGLGSEGYCGFCGVLLADTDSSEGYLSCSTSGGYFGTMSSIGFANRQPYLVLNGSAGGASCTGDFNDDGQVNGADFGSILAAWGPCAGCAEDLNGDGQVSGADVGLLLSVWGVCP